MSNKPKILLVTDSIGAARPEPEVTFWEDTYAYMLSSDYTVYQHSVGGARVNELDDACLAYLRQFRPDIVILQCGIVDCAPRAYKWIEERIFENYRFPRRLRNLISRTITTRKLRAKRRVVYTPINHYRACVEEIRDTFPSAQVYGIGILPPSDKYEEVNPGITVNVQKYNEVLKSVFGNRFIDMADIPADGIMSDLHHLNAFGHQYVYDQILKVLNGK